MAFSLAFTLSACGEGIARQRVRHALMDAGMAEAPAQCMAERMVDKLSISQLRKLEALKGHTHNAMEVILAVQRIDDPEVIRVTVTAAGICLAGLAH